MRCALIIPAWQPEELFSSKTAASQLNYWQPLGTLYVASSLQQAGHKVDFYNGAFLSHDDIIEQIAKNKPTMVGIYATTFGWYKALSTASAIKSVHPGCYICVGGPYPIAVQTECLKGHTQIDAVVTGEGEITVPELVHWLENTVNVGQVECPVEGLAYRLNSVIKLNPARKLVEEIDQLAFPARELLHDSKDYMPPPATYQRKPVAVIISSRGCNRRCIFCSQIDTQRCAGDRGIRFRSIANVLQEIELCLSQGYKEIKFIDDSLAADYNRIMSLCKEIVARKLDFSWFASACVNQVDRRLLQAMKDAGCWAILFGAESGVQRNLNTLRKGITLAQIEQAVHTAQDVGLIVSTPFLFGIPGQTYADGLKTIEFAIKLNPDLANFHALAAFPGTYLYEHREKYGRCSKNLQEYTYQGASFVPYTLNRTQIQTLRRLALRRFYLRPAFVWGKVKSLFVITANRNKFAIKINMEQLKSLLIGLKSLFWICLDKNIFKTQHKPDKSIRPPLA